MAENINRVKLAKLVSEDTGVDSALCVKAVDSVFSTMMAQMKAGNKVKISGFGTFERQDKPARSGVNPRTGEKIQIAARSVPKFKAGKTLKDTLQD